MSVGKTHLALYNSYVSPGQGVGETRDYKVVRNGSAQNVNHAASFNFVGSLTRIALPSITTQSSTTSRHLVDPIPYAL